MDFPQEIKQALERHPHKLFLFLDEAGTDADAPVAVVAGVMADPDGPQWAVLHSMATQMWQRIPEPYRHGFISHGKTIFSRERRADWEYAERKAFFLQLMSLPRLLGLGVVAAIVRPSNDIPQHPELRPENMRHLAAFGICVAAADQLIRLTGAADLVGFTFSEDCASMREYLAGLFHKLESEPHVFEGADVIGTGAPLDFRILRMRSVPFFLQKGPLMLQIADACAYGLRRAFAGLDGGPEYFQAIFGVELPVAGANRPFGRLYLPPKSPGQMTLVSDPNALMEKTFGIKAGQSLPMFNL